MSKAHETILVVDDEEMMRFLVTTMLEGSGLKVLAAESGEAALEMWRASNGEVDLLLTDFAMPGMNGLQLAEMLRAERPGLKVIFMTGQRHDFLAGGAAMVEGVNFLPKPCRMQTLAEAVRNRLDSQD